MSISTTTTPQWAIDTAHAIVREARSLVAQGVTPRQAATAVAAKTYKDGITLRARGPDARLWTKAAAARAPLLRSKGLSYEEIALELAPEGIRVTPWLKPRRKTRRAQESA